MLRRAALLAALLLPVAGRAAPAAGVIETVPTSFGKADCTSTEATVSFTWALAFESGTTSPPAGSYLQLLASDTSACPDASTSVRTAFIDQDITPGTTTTYGATNTVLRKTLIDAAGLSACDQSKKIYVCVRLYAEGTTTLLGKATGAIELVTSVPPAPKSVVVSPGEGALNVSWADGDATAGSAVATDYRVEVWPCPPGQEATCSRTDVRSGDTANKSLRIDGLTIGAQYKVVVYAFSAEGNVSPASAAAFGTPINAFDYWEKYQAMSGKEKGGCGGGPAGLLSLLAVAALAGALRRRS
ncbi:MAG: fibronectin type III domain-containing protein [Anaeromyxobacteraceae bacterium]|nr:fibronectin type III domain-containing protein [Anaeromyxobacteraceae bacterium]